MAPKVAKAVGVVMWSDCALAVTLYLSKLSEALRNTRLLSEKLRSAFLSSVPPYIPSKLALRSLPGPLTGLDQVKDLERCSVGSNSSPHIEKSCREESTGSQDAQSQHTIFGGSVEVPGLSPGCLY